ncbi:MAG: FecR domain-containing protein [Kiritimatiellaeota bacterium]|nr:FecR domain-containing protein [Kiritimatiellota bacterium]
MVRQQDTIIRRVRHALAITALFALIGPSWGQDSFHAISKKGQCKVRLTSAKSYVPLELNKEYPFSTALKTGRNSFAVIEFSNGNRFRVLARTKVVVTADVRNPKFKKLQLARGKVEVELDNFPPGARFSVETPTAVCGAVGTHFAVEFADVEEPSGGFFGRLFGRKYREHENRFGCTKGKIFARSPTFAASSLEAGTRLRAVVHAGRENSYSEISVPEGQAALELAGGNRLDIEQGGRLRTAQEKSATAEFVALTIEAGAAAAGGRRLEGNGRAVVLKKNEFYQADGVSKYVAAARTEGRLQTDLDEEKQKPAPDPERIRKLEAEVKKAAEKATRLRRRIAARNMRRIIQRVRRIRPRVR